MDLPAVLTALVLLALAVAAGVAAGLALRRPRTAGADVVDTVVAVADERLGATRNQIDGQLRALQGELARVTDTVARLERERSVQHGELKAQLEATVEQTANLSSTAGALREVLASPKARGQWGERMADDVLRLAGMAEGVNYVKQRAIAGGTVPDFTFLLPRGVVLHMDVKFPVSNYARCVESGSDHERAQYRDAFLRDVRARVRELTGRGYVDTANGTLGYLLLFIPNESVYAFVHEHDPGLVDLALAQKVVLCSPLTLFAVLAVVREAVEAFSVERTSGEILDVLAGFSAQWERFCESLDKVGRGLEGLDRAYQELSGTRRRALERPLARVDELRRQRSDTEPAGGDGLRLVSDDPPPTGTAEPDGVLV
ncbi:MAG: DNA recombination protein RmuC [Actinomycetota bacterium]|nr:DNA recombination protein RmuC [Actinomycetota bacterium]